MAGDDHTRIMRGKSFFVVEHNCRFRPKKEDNNLGVHILSIENNKKLFLLQTKQSFRIDHSFVSISVNGFACIT